MSRLRVGWLMACWIVAGPAWAEQIALSPLSVISASAPYANDYEASNVLDQQSGPSAELFAQHYWLSPDKTAAPVFFVIDLGASVRLISASLYNTHNGSYEDRGTGAFTLLAGNAPPAAGGMLAGATTLVSGTLAAATSLVPVAQQFAISVAAPFRYVEFIPMATATVERAASATAFGLNEIQLFSASPALAVPAPGGGSCLAAMAAVMLLSIRRRFRIPMPAGTRQCPASARPPRQPPSRVMIG